MSILSEILRYKSSELRALKACRPLSALKREAAKLRGKGRFADSLRRAKGAAVIAEIKRRSPSKGLIRRNFDAPKIARSYEKGGATALSVLTDEKYFGGSEKILRSVRQTSKLPILRKDFTIDEYQVYEAKLMGADAVLLIAAALSRPKMKKLADSAKKLGLDVLFEVHDASEMRKVLPLKPKLLGINNRDLKSFRVDLATTEKLAPMAPKGCLVVAESGIGSPEDIARLRKCGAKGFLVGESLMRDKEPGSALKRLLGKTRDPR